MDEDKGLYEVVAEVKLHVLGDSETDAEQTALRILADVSFDALIKSVI